MGSTRYFKTHAVIKQFPGGGMITDNIRIIYIARNPKDTVVSLYHHTKSKPEFNLNNCNFHQFCKLFLLGKVENSSWFDHVITWHQQCLVRYVLKCAHTYCCRCCYCFVVALIVIVVAVDVALP